MAEGRRRPEMPCCVHCGQCIEDRKERRQRHGSNSDEHLISNPGRAAPVQSPSMMSNDGPSSSDGPSVRAQMSNGDEASNVGPSVRPQMTNDDESSNVGLSLPAHISAMMARISQYLSQMLLINTAPSQTPVVMLDLLTAQAFLGTSSERSSSRITSQPIEVEGFAYVRTEAGIDRLLYRAHYSFGTNPAPSVVPEREHVSDIHVSDCMKDREVNNGENNESGEENVNSAELCPNNNMGDCEGDCPYLHGHVCHICHMPRLHPNHPEKHLDECFAQHKAQSQEIECNICLEKVSEQETNNLFAIQQNCHHSFCARCLDQWRKNQAMANNRACPVCRTPSGWVFSSSYWIACLKSKKRIFECAIRRHTESH